MSDQLSPMEAIMWRVGQDATLRMTLGALIIVDRPPTTEALGERLAFAAGKAPRLRRRPDDPTALRPRPAWVDDVDPTPERHLRSLSVAPPGSTRQLLELTGPARVDPVRSRLLTVGPDGDRGPGGRAGGPLPARPPRPDRRHRWDPPPRAAPRRAGVAAHRRQRRPLRRSGPQPSRAATATGIRARSRSPSTSRRRCAGSSAVSTRRATCGRPSRRCVASNGRSTSPTRCPGS